MKRILSFILCTATCSVAGPPSIDPFDGARYMFVGASATSNYRWPAYFAAYFSLRYPQYTLHYAMDARSGTSIARMFGNNEFGWDTDTSISNYHVHYRTVQPWDADFVFIQHAESGGYPSAEDAQHRQSYIENYLKPDGMVPVIINGWQDASPIPSSVAAEIEEEAINELAVANDWNSSTIFDLTAAKWGNEYRYTADAATDVITAVGNPFANGMRVRVGRRTGTHAAPLDKAPNDYYVRDVSGDTFKLALTKGGEAINLTTSENGDLRISRKWALINGHDTGHFGAAGYMVLWKYMMDSLGYDTSVSQAKINAATLSVTSQNQCTISNVAANGYGGVDFQRLDNRLPYVLDDDWWDEAVELEPDLLTHQDYSMTVTGLNPGDYDIYVNSVLICRATEAELAEGWNMAALQVGPVFEKGKEVLGRIRDAQGRVRADHELNAALSFLSPTSGFERFKASAAASYNVAGNRGAAHVAALAAERKKLDELDALIQASAQPETLTFSIRSSIQIRHPKGPKTWNYAGVPHPDWAYDPFTYPSPTAPAEWPAAEHAGYYYIAADHPNATDVVDESDTTDAAKRRYGYPDRPRATLPEGAPNSVVFPAGAVVWIKGGTHDGPFHGKTLLDGTSTSPVWIYGDPNDKPTFRQGLTLIVGQYFFIDGINWVGGNNSNGAIRFGSSTVSFDTHHGILRNCRFENRDYIAGSGALVGISPPSGAGQGALRDLVCYKLTFKNCGGGYDWNVGDNDHHGIKISGYDDGIGQTASRIWIVECVAERGDAVDPVDGIYKSLSGNLVQVGDDSNSLGGVHHVYIAGNTTDRTRQSGIGLKRCTNIVISGNTVHDVNRTAAAGINVNFNKRQNIWILGNEITSCAGGIHLGSAGADTNSIYVVGNICHNNRHGEMSTGWRYMSGVGIWDARGKIYIVNNTFDDQAYGVYFAPRSTSQSAGSELHIYNNIITNCKSAIDPDAAGIRISNWATRFPVYIENNLFDALEVYLDGVGTITNSLALNSLASASANLQGSPLYNDPGNNHYTLSVSSPAIDAGVRQYTTNDSPDVYQLFLSAFANDPDFPGKPEDVWPRDWMGKPRVQGRAIDIGAIERAAIDPPEFKPGSGEKPRGEK